MLILGVLGAYSECPRCLFGVSWVLIWSVLGAYSECPRSLFRVSWVLIRSVLGAYSEWPRFWFWFSLGAVIIINTNSKFFIIIFKLPSCLYYFSYILHASSHFLPTSLVTEGTNLHDITASHQPSWIFFFFFFLAACPFTCTQTWIG